VHAARWAVAVLIAALCGCAAGCGDDGGAASDAPDTGRGLYLHPDNPRYLTFRGRPTVLITSGEHYGAVVNADFDELRYLESLKRDGFNLTRVFSGSYTESASFIDGVGARNTLAPRPARLISPWVRTADGKYDLERWNPAYFDRLVRFVGEAGRRGIVVELVLFSALYEDVHWRASPFNPGNNADRSGPSDVRRLHTLGNDGALRHQDALVSKLVKELAAHDNVYFEVINEGTVKPAPASRAWQDHVIETIEEADSASGATHLIARWYPATGAPDLSDPHPSVAIFNFHYMRDPSPHLNLPGVVAFDETGFQGTADATYRRDAWFFMLSGGGVYSHLDWSYAVGHEDGGYRFPPETPGGGGPALRRSLAGLKRFMDRFDLPRMKVAHGVVDAPPETRARVLADRGREYGVYLEGGDGGGRALAIDLEPGRYRAEWVDTRDGSVTQRRLIDHDGGAARLVPPRHGGEIALAIERAPGAG
jgi:hypothetical protein